MARTTLNWLAALTVAAFPGPSVACIYPPPPIPLPNETDDAYQRRSEATSKAQADEDRRRYQTYLFDQADRIELAMVRTSTPIPFAEAGGALGAKVEVEPVTPLKGVGSKGSIALSDTKVTTCGIGGSGTATSAQPGDYVIVFHNISFRDDPRPFGIKLVEAREPRILSALTDAALLLRDGPKPGKPKP